MQHARPSFARAVAFAGASRPVVLRARMSPETFRVRRLSTTGAGVVDSRYRGGGIGGAFNSMSDQAGAVYDVSAQEETLPHEEVVSRLKRGALRSTDLVYVDGKWSTLLDSMPFGE